ncbi:hypothetical protein BGP_1884 [Beggiatoa sp. PS]|nr:hypothetical protein BGP_1884 [Beggiatoa sp. PS]
MKNRPIILIAPVPNTISLRNSICRNLYFKRCISHKLFTAVSLTHSFGTKFCYLNNPCYLGAIFHHSRGKLYGTI